MPECWKESALLGPLHFVLFREEFFFFIIMKSTLLRDGWIDEPILYRFFPNGII